MPSKPSPPEMALAGASQGRQAWPPLCTAPPVLKSTTADKEGGGSGAEIAQPMTCLHQGNKTVQASSVHGAVDAAAQELMSLLGM